MNSPVELFVGLRYLRAKRRTRFVSFITGVSVAGIAVGVAALIVILSVMNGFEAELRDRLLSMSAHGQVSTQSGEVDDWPSLQQTVAGTEGVIAAAPFVDFEGMIQAGRELRPVIIHGVDPELELELSGEQINLLNGELGGLQPGERGIVLGRLIAYDIGVGMGDDVVLLIPRPGDNGLVEPTLERFVVRGIFEAGLQDHDATLALVNIRDAASILGLGDAVEAMRFRADDVMRAPEIARRINASDASLASSDWTRENASYFRAIRIEKMMMSLVLSLIIGVAAFNIVASLVMVVTDKTNDIAVLRTLGMSPDGVVRVFFVQGAAIGWAGVLVGVLGGIILAIYVPDIAPVLERLFGFQIMPGDVYYVTQIPSILDWGHVAIIGVSAFVLTSLATLYPARRAALVNPAAALRYE